MNDTDHIDEPTQPDREMCEMLRQILAPLVDCPDCLKVDAARNGDAVTFAVRVAAPDLDRFRGRHARTGESLRVVVAAAGMRLKRRYLLTFEAIGPESGAAANPPAPLEV